MVKCCSCSAKGRCSNCSCVKAGKRCSNCTPSAPQHSSCLNLQGKARPPDTRRRDSQPASHESQPGRVRPLLSSPGAQSASQPNVGGTARVIEPTLSVLSDGSPSSSSTLTLSSQPCSNDGTPSNPVNVDRDRDHDIDHDHEARAKTMVTSSLATMLSSPANSAQDVLDGATRTAMPSIAALQSTSTTEASESHHQAINTAYDAVVQFRRNVFNVPFGAAGTSFVNEIAHLIGTFTEKTQRREIAWKSVCIACHLLLQKPTADGSNKLHSQHLDRRLSLWRDGRVIDLLDEAACIQRHLPSNFRTKHQARSRDGPSDTVFAKLVFDGKMNSALRYLSDESSGHALSMDDTPIPSSSKTVREVLLDKHPRAQSPPSEALLDGDPLEANPIIFERITPKIIKEVARRSHGAAGPSGLDADAWKRMATCYKEASNRLCSSLAAAAKELCTADLSGVDMSAFTAARLIPLDKKPGVRPIAVGEVFRRIIGKTIMRVIERDVLECTAPLQLCIGVPSACEAAVHAMDRLFRNPSVEGMLFVDASNAFNSMNRSAALHNIPRVCPALAKVFSNTYRQPIRLFVTGGGEITSVEGTCQGDPLAMAIYSVAMVPLVRKMQDSCPSSIQCWYADDDGTADALTGLQKYWTRLLEIGPGYGYYPHATKTILLAKEEHKAEASRLFAETGITIKFDGCRYLGGAVGEDDFCRSYMAALAEKWEKDLRTLADIAQTQPHAAYAAFTKGLSSRWSYHLRCTACPPQAFGKLDELINEFLLPALTGRAFAYEEPQRDLLSLPARLGGLSIPKVQSLAESEKIASASVTEPFVDLIAPRKSVEITSAPAQQEAAQNPVVHALAVSRGMRRAVHAERRSATDESAKSLAKELPVHQQLLMSIAGQKGVSSWLTADPSADTGMMLNKVEFRDAVCLRYGFAITDLPSSCVCGTAMTTDHAMTCPSGGYPTARHNEVRDLLAGTMEGIFRDVEIEPKLLPYDNEELPGRTANRSESARVDIKARGVWSRQQEAFFDIRITHPKAILQSSEQVKKQLATHEREKKRAYAQRINVIDRGVFTPLVFATNGMIGPECDVFLKYLASKLTEKNNDISYSTIISRLRCKLSFALLRWSVTCLRGARASYKQKTNAFITECRLASSHF